MCIYIERYIHVVVFYITLLISKPVKVVAAVLEKVTSTDIHTLLAEELPLGAPG